MTENHEAPERAEYPSQKLYDDELRGAVMEVKRAAEAAGNDPDLTDAVDKLVRLVATP